MFHDTINCSYLSILSRLGSQFHKYHLLYCKRVGRQSNRHPLNSDLTTNKNKSCSSGSYNISSSRLIKIVLVVAYVKVTIVEEAVNGSTEKMSHES